MTDQELKEMRDIVSGWKDAYESVWRRSDDAWELVREMRKTLDTISTVMLILSIPFSFIVVCMVFAVVHFMFGWKW